MLHSSEKHSEGNSLAIRLTEPVVFLRSDGSLHHQPHTEERPSVLRGLLILNLTKPTKITSIDIELTAKTRITWPEGLGARRVEVSEENRIFRASTVSFKASNEHSRRAISIGPGVGYPPKYDASYDDWEELHVDNAYHHSQRIDGREQGLVPTEDNSHLRSRHHRFTRNASVDISHFQSHDMGHQELTPDAPLRSPDIPPTTSSTDNDGPSPVSSCHLPREPSFARSLEGVHVVLNSHSRSPSSRNHPLPHSSLSGSQHYDISGTPEHVEGQEESQRDKHEGSNAPRQASPPPTERGRLKGRFMLSAVSSVLMGAIQSGPPVAGHSREGSHDLERGNIIRGRARDKRPIDHLPGPNRSAHRGTEKGGSRTGKKVPKETLLSKVGEILKLDLDEHKEFGENWKEFKKGIYTYPISFQIPGHSPPTVQCDFGTVIWRLRAHVHRPGTFRAKYAASREVMVISYPTDDDTEDSENVFLERHWDQQLQYLITISGRSFYIGGTIPITIKMLPLAKVKTYRLAMYLEERVEYYTNAGKLARLDPIRRFELLSIHNSGKNPAPILPLDFDDPGASLNSPFWEHVAPLMEHEEDISELASALMGPGPWSFPLNLKLPPSCTMLRPTNKNKKANIIVNHQLKVVMRIERGDNLYLDKSGKRKLFDIVVQTPVHILSCRCNTDWISLPRYSETIDEIDPIAPSCPCRVPRTQAAQAEASSSISRHNAPSTLSRAASRHSTDSSVTTVDSAPVNSVLMRSLRQMDDLLTVNSLFERLVSGQESEVGETPPAYEALAGIVANTS